MIAPADLALDPDRAALLVLDVQDRLASAMPEQPLDQLERNVAVLAEMARRFGLPVVVTEQYPKGLGRTRAAVESAVAELGSQLHRFEKLEFSACDAGAFGPIWEQLGRDQWIVIGMECHVCVYQSARGLRERGATVFVPQDAVVSRSKQNWRLGLGLMDTAGCVVTSTEVLVFDALKRAGSEDFKALSRLIR